LGKVNMIILILMGCAIILLGIVAYFDHVESTEK